MGETPAQRHPLGKSQSAFDIGGSGVDRRAEANALGARGVACKSSSEEMAGGPPTKPVRAGSIWVQSS
jgi:hypothetical protein